MKRVICNNCGDVFKKENYRIKNLNFCNRQCYLEYTKDKNSTRCELCGVKFHRPRYRIKKYKVNFCSSDCHKKYLNNFGYRKGKLKKEKHTGSPRKGMNMPKRNYGAAYCRVCGSLFDRGIHNAEICSDKCRSKIGINLIRSLKNNKFKCGNFIEYKGKKMRSSWEVKFARWLDNEGIDWVYESQEFKTGIYGKYIPDFYIPCSDVYIEVKGLFLNNSLEKFSYWKDREPNRFFLFDRPILKNLGII